MNQINKTRNPKLKKFILLAFFTAVASVIQLYENLLFPSSFPFRIGIANIIILLVIDLFGPGEAILVAASRSILASLLTGKLFSVPFFLGLSGGIFSAVIMGLLFNRFSELSIIGISVIGALTHNLTQLFVIFSFFIHNQGIFNLLPWMLLTALVTGMVIGLICKVLFCHDFYRKLAACKYDEFSENCIIL
jgi:heptaprenyl diphosphate synthase